VSAVLVIGGCDSSGGAGLVRDVRTLTDLRTAALCAVTAVTAQSTSGVIAVHHVPPETVRAQIEAALASGRVAAIKIGMLGCRATVLAVTASLSGAGTLPVVLDPVLAASSGGELLDAEGCNALRAGLLSRATLLTPNIPEAAALLGVLPGTSEATLLEQARALLALGARAVLMKGGHGEGELATDLLVVPGEALRRLSAPRSSRSQRGTGCALAAAIAAGLAARLDLAEACVRAKAYVTELLQHGD
jgi:hydroxymethylpyrimidine/phosphomethylpyrimidine kinase